MAYQHGRAGKSTREMAKKRRNDAIWIAVFGIMTIIILWFFLENSKAFGIGGIGILVLLVLIRIIPDFVERGADKKFREEKRAIRGAQAEEKVGDILADLSTDFYVLHDIESPYGNIDHIVIGKNNGIFLLETKAHGGKVTIEGDTLLVNAKLPEKDFIAQCLRNTYWLRDEVEKVVGLKPWISPILVFTNAFVSATRPVKGVRIVNKKYLSTLLNRTTQSNALNAKVWDHKKDIGIKLVSG